MRLHNGGVFDCLYEERLSLSRLRKLEEGIRPAWTPTGHRGEANQEGSLGGAYGVHRAASQPAQGSFPGKSRRPPYRSASGLGRAGSPTR